MEHRESIELDLWCIRELDHKLFVKRWEKRKKTNIWNQFTFESTTITTMITNKSVFKNKNKNSFSRFTYSGSAKTFNNNVANTTTIIVAIDFKGWSFLKKKTTINKQQFRV